MAARGTLPPRSKRMRQRIVPRSRRRGGLPPTSFPVEASTPTTWPLLLPSAFRAKLRPRRSPAERSAGKRTRGRGGVGVWGGVVLSSLVADQLAPFRQQPGPSSGCPAPPAASQKGYSADACLVAYRETFPHMFRSGTGPGSVGLESLVVARPAWPRSPGRRQVPDFQRSVCPAAFISERP